jgi:hypothetical protein
MLVAVVDSYSPFVPPIMTSVQSAATTPPLERSADAIIGDSPALFRWLLAIGAIFAVLVIWRRDILFDPPYFEFATGLFTEANFLADTGFDYHRLRYEEKYGGEGGALCYMTSVLPTLVAVFMRATAEPARAFLYYHLFNIACAALTLVSVYALVVRHVGRLLAILCAAAVVTNPVFSTQVDMLGMDLPMTAFCALATALVINGWRLTGILASLVAFFMKPTGALATIALLAFLALVLARDLWQWYRATNQLGKSAAIKRDVVGLSVGLAVLVIELGVSRWGGLNEQLVGVIPAENSFLDAWLICPDLLLIALVTWCGSLVFLWTSLHGSVFTEATATAAAKRAGVGSRVDVVVICWLMIVPTTAAIMRYGFVCPRYFTLWTPYLFALLGLLLERLPWRAPWSAAVVTAIVVLNLVNGDGRFLPQPDEVTTWSRSENRCRVYRADMRSTIAAMKEIEDKCADEPILAGIPFQYYLALPRLGYVSRPLHGYSVNAFENERFPNWATALVDRPESLIVLWAKNYYYSFAMAQVPPPEPGDEVVFRSDDPSPLVVYRKRFSKTAWQSGEAERWILEHTWHEPNNLAKSLPRADLLVAVGRPDLAIRLLELGAQTGGDQVDLRVRRCEFLAQAGRIEEAQLELEAILKNHPRHERALLQQGVLAEATGNNENALRYYRTAVEAHSSSELARYRLALLLLRLRDLTSAASELRECIRLNPRVAGYRNALGVALAQQGQFEAARGEFEQALRLAPGDPTATSNLQRLNDPQFRRDPSE